MLLPGMMWAAGSVRGRVRRGRLVGFPCGPRMRGGGAAAAAGEVADETRAPEGTMVSRGVMSCC